MAIFTKYNNPNRRRRTARKSAYSKTYVEERRNEMYQLLAQAESDEERDSGGKAIVVIEDSGAETLYSYGTPIIKRLVNGELIKLYDGWTQTTGKHIKAFCGLNKAEYTNL